MNSFGLEFHHFGLAVRRPDEAISLLGNLDCLIGEKIFDPEQNVNLILCRHRQMPMADGGDHLSRQGTKLSTATYADTPTGISYLF